MPPGARPIPPHLAAGPAPHPAAGAPGPGGVPHPYYRHRPHHRGYPGVAGPAAPGSPSHGFAVAGSVAAAGGNGRAPLPGGVAPGVIVPGRGAAPSAAFAAGAPGAGGVPTHHHHRHLPLEGRWKRHGRQLIVFLG